MLKKNLTNELYLAMVSLREHIKLLHFQTANYSLHKITDQFLDTYDKLFDQFWEQKQAGKFRINLTNRTTVNLINMRKYKDLEPLLDNVTELLTVMGEGDDIISSIDQFKYLVSFK